MKEIYDIQRTEAEEVGTGKMVTRKIADTHKYISMPCFSFTSLLYYSRCMHIVYLSHQITTIYIPPLALRDLLD